MLGGHREEGRKGAVCESGERVNGEDAYSRGRRELMGTMRGGDSGADLWEQPSWGSQPRV